MAVFPGIRLFIEKSQRNIQWEWTLKYLKKVTPRRKTTVLLPVENNRQNQISFMLYEDSDTEVDIFEGPMGCWNKFTSPTTDIAFSFVVKFILRANF